MRPNTRQLTFWILDPSAEYTGMRLFSFWKPALQQTDPRYDTLWEVKLQLRPNRKLISANPISGLGLVEYAKRRGRTAVAKELEGKLHE